LSTNGSGLLASVGRNQDKDASGMAWMNYRLKPKDMVPIPWMVAMALQQDGWFLRQDLIWAKPNPMPESVRDRCTKSHEYLFLLAKSERYYFDADAIAEPGVTGDLRKPYAPGQVDARGNGHDRGGGKLRIKGEGTPRNDGARWNENNGKGFITGTTRNKRSVWTVTTQPFKEAHFATFPPALIEPCILAGCPVGGTVLDPFGGAGTTGLVADRHGRDAILIELNPSYAEMARKRIEADKWNTEKRTIPMFEGVA
jgi:DNA modification methylase